MYSMKFLLNFYILKNSLVEIYIYTDKIVIS